MLNALVIRSSLRYDLTPCFKLICLRRGRETEGRMTNSERLESESGYKEWVKSAGCSMRELGIKL